MWRGDRGRRPRDRLVCPRYGSFHRKRFPRLGRRRVPRAPSKPSAPRLAATIRAVPVPDLGRFIGSASRAAVAQRGAAGVERGQHECALFARQAGTEQQRVVVVIAAQVGPLVLGRADLLAQSPADGRSRASGGLSSVGGRRRVERPDRVQTHVPLNSDGHASVRGGGGVTPRSPRGKGRRHGSGKLPTCPPRRKLGRFRPLERHTSRPAPRGVPFVSF
jgi:hypothetical protein